MVIDAWSCKFVIVRGSATVSDWVNINFKFSRKSTEKGIFHKGFHEEAIAGLERVGAHLAGDVPVYFSGHSMGGAVAAIISDIWEYNGGVGKRTPYVFATPKFSELRVSNSIRRYAFVRASDPVPKLPIWFFDHEMAAMKLVPPDIEFHSLFKDLAKSSIFGYKSLFAPHAMESYRYRLGQSLGELHSQACYVDLLNAAGRRAGIHMPFASNLD